MPLKSKYDGACKDCGKPHLKGDTIDMNNNEHWCIDGKNCQGAMQLEGSPKPTPTSKPAKAVPVNDENSFEFARKCVIEFLDCCNSQEIDKEGVKDQLGAVWNTAMIQAGKR